MHGDNEYLLYRINRKMEKELEELTNIDHKNHHHWVEMRIQPVFNMLEEMDTFASGNTRTYYTIRSHGYTLYKNRVDGKEVKMDLEGKGILQIYDDMFLGSCVCEFDTKKRCEVVFNHLYKQKKVLHNKNFIEPVIYNGIVQFAIETEENDIDAVKSTHGTYLKMFDTLELAMQYIDSLYVLKTTSVVLDVVDGEMPTMKRVNYAY